jgi:tetratricopeptide (TPR) repeat protein
MSAMLRRFFRCVLLAVGTLLLAGVLQAQTSQQPPAPVKQPPQGSPVEIAPKPDPERQHAADLYNSGNFVEAMPLLEKLAADHPNETAIKASWAFAIMAYSATLTDAELRRKGRVRARNLALEAQKQGDTSATVQLVLQIPEDGSEPAFSDRKEVDNAMKTAEADFVRGDLDKARTGYLHALLLDPNNYSAALFIGDVYFKQHVNGSAGEWFARAIQIDPDRETAYRYWGDALWAMGKSAAAREKYINAIIAEPYNRMSWGGLAQWSQRTKTTLNWVRLQDKGAVSQQGDKHINITIDPSSTKKDDPGGAAWVTYGMERALWNGEKFKKEFPELPAYRRTMREEADCLHLMVTVLKEQEDFEKKKKNLEPTLQQLVQIDEAGFLEPFALLNRADKDIAQDYDPYRAIHRHTLYRYFDEFVVPKAAQ